MNFWKNPEYTAVRVILGVVLVAAAAFFVFKYVHSDSLSNKGSVLGSAASSGILVPAGGNPGNVSKAAPGPITGMGGAGTITKFTDTNTVASSALMDNGTSISIGRLFFGGDQGGAIELGGNNTVANTNGAIPYIDFHYGVGKPQDFNTRIINNGDNKLEIQNMVGTPLSVNGNTVTVNNLNVTGKLTGASVSTGAAPSNFTSETHFSNGNFVDPAPGVQAAIKATTIATGGIIVDGETPIYRINPACFEGSSAWKDNAPNTLGAVALGGVGAATLAAGVFVGPFALAIPVVYTGALLVASVFSNNNWNDNILKTSAILTTSVDCYNKNGTHYRNTDYGVYGFVLPGNPHPKGDNK